MVRLHLAPSRCVGIIQAVRYLWSIYYWLALRLAVNKKIRVSALAIYIKIGQQKCCEENKWCDMRVSTWEKVGDSGQEGLPKEVTFKVRFEE